MATYDEKIQQLKYIEDTITPSLLKNKTNLSSLEDLLTKKIAAVSADKAGDTEKASINKALNQIKTYKILIGNNIQSIEAGIASSKSQLQSALSSINDNFKKSATDTKIKITALQNLTTIINDEEKNITTKKRQNVLSRDEIKYKVVMFFTLIVINITLAAYITHLIHK